MAVGSERELGREMDALGQQLRNEEDWAARLKAPQSHTAQGHVGNGGSRGDGEARAPSVTRYTVTWSRLKG